MPANTSAARRARKSSKENPEGDPRIPGNLYSLYPMSLNRKEVRRRVHVRIRRKVSGTPERPRLAVHFSNKNVYAQLIDDTKGVTIASASTKDADVGVAKANLETAEKVGSLLASRARAAKVESVVFDRGGHLYHGKVKALADAARAGGLKF